MGSPEKRGCSSAPSEERLTVSGIRVKRCYTSADLQKKGGLLEAPGEFPFTRGIHPTMYRGRLWTMRQYAGFGDAEETNARFRYLLGRGQTGLSIAFDLPTQMGYDSDHPMAEGEVGRVGVAVCSLRDMEVLFRGIRPDRVSTSMTINATAPIILAMYLVMAGENGCRPESLRGTVQNDILKEYIARGTYIFPPGPSMDLVLDVFEHCAVHAPRWNCMSVSGYHMREAGCTAVQEVAFTLANAVAYLEAARKRGLDIDRASEQMSFFFCAGMHILEEVAKFRAARRLWARIARERLGISSKRGWMLRFHVQTSGYTLTAQEPENNIVRVALEALAAVLGGSQSIHTNSMDEALGLPGERSVRIALRTQQIIAHETGVVDTVDPAGGAYYIEWLTDVIEEQASEYINKIDDMGGMPAAIEAGFVQREISRSSYEHQIDVERGARGVIGVNIHPAERGDIPTFRINDQVVERHLERLSTLRRGRDEVRVRDALQEVGSSAGSGENIVPVLMRAVRAHATIGEICDSLREVYGEYRARDEVV